MTESALPSRRARVYCAGPFRARPEPQNQWLQHLNIEKANALSYEVWRLGAAGFCPHKNSENLEGSLPPVVFLEGDLAWLEVADAVIVTENWMRSEGAREEVRLALAWGIPVFRFPGSLAAWLERTPLTYRRLMPPAGEPNIAEVAACSVLSGRLQNPPSSPVVAPV